MAIDYGMIGQRLQVRRIDHKLTQEVLAEKAGITVVYLSKVENGRVHPTLELLDTLCGILDLDLSMLLSGAQTALPSYGNERLNQRFAGLSSQSKQVALNILEELAKLWGKAKEEKRFSFLLSLLYDLFLKYGSEEMVPFEYKYIDKEDVAVLSFCNRLYSFGGSQYRLHITKVDCESGFDVASRRLVSQARRYGGRHRDPGGAEVRHREEIDVQKILTKW